MFECVDKHIASASSASCTTENQKPGARKRKVRFVSGGHPSPRPPSSAEYFQMPTSLGLPLNTAVSEWPMGKYSGEIWVFPVVSGSCVGTSIRVLRNTRRPEKAREQRVTWDPMLPGTNAPPMHDSVRRWEPRPTTPGPVVRHCTRGIIPDQECRGTGPVGRRRLAWGVLSLAWGPPAYARA